MSSATTSKFNDDVDGSAKRLQRAYIWKADKAIIHLAIEGEPTQC
jgi:hypothetical protein